jgi:predicted metal-dependent peptidase
MDEKNTDEEVVANDELNDDISESEKQITTEDIMRGVHQDEYEEGGAENSIDQTKLPLVSVEEAKNFKIDEAIRDIYQHYPFLGYVFSSIKRKEAWFMPTAGISADNILYYNPRFMASLDDDGRKFVLLHELLHKIHSHFSRGDEILKQRHGMTSRAFIEWRETVRRESNEGDGCTLDEVKEHYAKVDTIDKLLNFMNYCEDLAINQSCEKKFKRLPIGVFLDDVNKQTGLNMEAFREWEYYFRELEKSGNGASETVSHDVQISFGDPNSGNGMKVKLSEAQKKQFDKEFEQLCKKGHRLQKRHEAKHAGNGPNYTLTDILPDMEVEIKDREVWKNLINHNFGYHRINDQEATLKRPDRRNENNPWGKRRRTMNKHTVVVLDTSGSCDHVIDKFLGCINKAMKKYKTTIDLLCTTTHVYNVYQKLKTIDMGHIKLQGGGTDLTTAQKWVIKNKPNEGQGINVVVLTDGYTDWIEDTKFTVSAIYTETHSPLAGVSNFATVYED